MSLSKGEGLILNVIQRDPGLGKTAVMKVLFILQEVKGIQTGYDFSIYTYGPYSSEVMEEIDQLVSSDLISCMMYPSHTYIGYKLTLQEKGKAMMPCLSDIESNAMTDVIQFEKDKSAKDLELYSTIIYVDRLFKKNSWEFAIEDLAQKVHEIKPHFTIRRIQEAYQQFSSISYV